MCLMSASWCNTAHLLSTTTTFTSGHVMCVISQSVLLWHNSSSQRGSKQSYTCKSTIFHKEQNILTANLRKPFWWDSSERETRNRWKIVLEKPLGRETLGEDRLEHSHDIDFWETGFEWNNENFHTHGASSCPTWNSLQFCNSQLHRVS
jgi:hypothetical protein